MTPEIKQEKQNEEVLIRIMSTDIPGDKKVLAGLTKIKGISWAFSNAICKVLKIDKDKKVRELSKDEIAKISEFAKNPKLPKYLLNRRKDLETGEDRHLVGSDLQLRKEFDIKRLKKMRCFRGIRHSTGQPVRGQRTKAHFRENKALGVAKKKK
jgi:small subunit ribosomal protein S13